MDSQYTPHRIVLSSTLRHQDDFGRAIRRPFLRANRSIFGCYKMAIFFFQTRFKLWNSVFKMLNFQNIEKLISLHMHSATSKLSLFRNDPFSKLSGS